jgi:hypothetical protein
MFETTNSDCKQKLTAPDISTAAKSYTRGKYDEKKLLDTFARGKKTGLNKLLRSCRKLSLIVTFF